MLIIQRWGTGPGCPEKLWMGLWAAWPSGWHPRPRHGGCAVPQRRPEPRSGPGRGRAPHARQRAAGPRRCRRAWIPDRGSASTDTGKRVLAIPKHFQLKVLCCSWFNFVGVFFQVHPPASPPTPPPAGHQFPEILQGFVSRNNENHNQRGF